MEKILIDGYNLIHKDERLLSLSRSSLEQAREALVDLLAGYRSGEVVIVVVFDGQPGTGPRTPARRGVRTVFSRAPRTADDLLLEMIAAERRRASLLVVTSDVKDIGRAARAEGARWISSEAFLRRLAPAAKRRTARVAGARDKPEAVDAAEVDYWLRKFDPGLDAEGREVASPPRPTRLRAEDRFPAGRGYRGGSGRR